VALATGYPKKLPLMTLKVESTWPIPPFPTPHFGPLSPCQQLQIFESSQPHPPNLDKFHIIPPSQNSMS
jgi:hypothetical protein